MALANLPQGRSGNPEHNKVLHIGRQFVRHPDAGSGFCCCGGDEFLMGFAVGYPEMKLHTIETARSLRTTFEYDALASCRTAAT